MKSTVKKIDEELQIVWAEVYAPDIPDSQGDYMTEEQIRLAAYKFASDGRLGMIDKHHNNEVLDAVVVETFIAREEDPIFIKGAWVVGVHVRDDETWAEIKNGDLNGFSLEGSAVKGDGELEFEIPEYVIGETTEVEGHVHKFKVFFNEEGEFIGGYTDTIEGHSHKIRAGTKTDTVNDHSHRFSFVESAYAN